MDIYVGNLPYQADDQQLNELFAQYGTVTSARVITDKFTGESKGYRLGGAWIPAGQDKIRLTLTVPGLPKKGPALLAMEGIATVEGREVRRRARRQRHLLGARPRIGARRLDAMASIIAELISVDPARVSVKAATGNLSGDEGAGRVISASCLVSVVPR